MCVCVCQNDKLIEFNLLYTSQRLPSLPDKVFTRLDKLTRQNREAEWVSGCGVSVV